MQRVDLDAVDPGPTDGPVGTLGLSGPLDATDVAINRYRVPPDEGLPAGLHAHTDQEEVFLVLSGTATFETLVPPAVTDGEPRWSGGGDVETDVVVVDRGEAIRFPPGEFQSARNGGDGELVVLAIGAPADSEDVRIPVACPDCGHGDLRIAFDGGETTFECPDCGVRRVPADCPACGSADLGVILADGPGTAVECRDCGSTYGDPPYEG